MNSKIDKDAEEGGFSTSGTPRKSRASQEILAGLFAVKQGNKRKKGKASACPYLTHDAAQPT